MTVRIHLGMDPARPLAALPKGLSSTRIALAVETALRTGGESELCVDVILVDDPTLADLHEKFLGDPTPTDVMSFDLRSDPGDGVPTTFEAGEAQAEIYVSVERAQAVKSDPVPDGGERTRVPASSTRSVADEILLYAVHGALHLCGYDDHDPQERRAMRRAEFVVLRELDCTLDEALHLDA